MGVIWLLYLVKEMQMRNIVCHENLSCRPERGVSTSPLVLVLPLHERLVPTFA